MDLEGLYSGHAFALAPIENNYSLTTRFHEASHKMLIEGSPWGQMIVCLKDLIEIETSRERRSKYHFPICKTLMDASEVTLESFAVLFTLHEARLRDDKNQIDKLMKSDYARIYSDKYLQIYLSFKPVKHAFQICKMLADFAMDTYLLDIETAHWNSDTDLYHVIRSDPKCYHPDFRFKKLVNALYDLLPKDENGKIIIGVDFRFSMQEIIERAGLCNLYLEQEKKKRVLESFNEMMRNVFQNEESILYALERLNDRITISDMELSHSQINQFEIPASLNQYEPLQFRKEEFYLVNKFSTLRAFLYEDIIDLIYTGTEVKRFVAFQVCWENVQSYIDIFKNEIILGFVDYQYAQSKALFSSNPRRVFYYIECLHDTFKPCLLKLGSNRTPYIHFQKINQTTYGIFAQIKENEILFSFQKTYAYNMFVDDVFNGQYKYVQLGDSLIDNIFYKEKTDHYRYGTVIKTILQVDNAGQRVYLKGYKVAEN